MENKVNLIYLMGAARSGTTALATFLGGHDEINSVGEMHQFFEHLEQDKTCSCGEPLTSCPFWSKIIQELPTIMINESKEKQIFCKQFEYHTAALNLLLGRYNKEQLKHYHELQNNILTSIKANRKSQYILDSAKYIGRHLSLRKNKQISIKTFYVVRDVRGVINSFSKNVQSSRNPLSTIFYYLAINITSEIIFRVSSKNSIQKIQYEEFFENPEKSLIAIGHFLKLDMHSVIKAINQNETFVIGHIIGGNRLKNEQKIKIRTDNSWKNNQSRFWQIIYYIMASPVMLLNKYKI